MDHVCRLARKITVLDSSLRGLFLYDNEELEHSTFPKPRVGEGAETDEVICEGWAMDVGGVAREAFVA